MFHIGQEVVCVSTVGAGQGYGDEIRPVIGEKYHIRGCRIADLPPVPVVLLCEIVNPQRSYTLCWDRSTVGMSEFWFLASHFRPVRTTDISIFTAMLRPVKEDA